MRRPGQAERALELLQHHLLAVAAREQVGLERERRVLLGHAPPARRLRPALGRRQLHPAPRAAATSHSPGQLRLRQRLRQEDLAAAA